jgi:hypothetical protein
MFPVTLDCEELDRRHSENNLGHTLWIPGMKPESSTKKISIYLLQGPGILIYGMASNLVCVYIYAQEPVFECKVVLRVEIFETQISGFSEEPNNRNAATNFYYLYGQYHMDLNT